MQSIQIVYNIFSKHYNLEFDVMDTGDVQSEKAFKIRNVI